MQPNASQRMSSTRTKTMFGRSAAPAGRAARAATTITASILYMVGSSLTLVPKLRLETHVLRNSVSLFETAAKRSFENHPFPNRVWEREWTAALLLNLPRLADALALLPRPVAQLVAHLVCERLEPLHHVRVLLGDVRLF